MRAALYLSAGNVIVDDVPDASLVPAHRRRGAGSALLRLRFGPVVLPRGHQPRGSDRGWVTSSSASSRKSAAEVSTLRVGDLVVAPFMWSDNTCPACVDGMQSSCDNGGTFGAPGTDGGQGEAVRVPQADGTLVAVPGGVSGVDETLYPRFCPSPT